jgi:hypothetical protein
MNAFLAYETCASVSFHFHTGNCTQNGPILNYQITPPQKITLSCGGSAFFVSEPKSRERAGNSKRHREDKAFSPVDRRIKEPLANNLEPQQAKISVSLACAGSRPRAH